MGKRGKINVLGVVDDDGEDGNRKMAFLTGGLIMLSVEL